MGGGPPEFACPKPLAPSLSLRSGIFIWSRDHDYDGRSFPARDARDYRTSVELLSSTTHSLPDCNGERWRRQKSGRNMCHWGHLPVKFQKCKFYLLHAISRELSVVGPTLPLYLSLLPVCAETSTDPFLLARHFQAK